MKIRHSHNKHFMFAAFSRLTRNPLRALLAA
jgi:hypothetical protein